MQAEAEKACEREHSLSQVEGDALLGLEEEEEEEGEEAS